MSTSSIKYRPKAFSAALRLPTDSMLVHLDLTFNYKFWNSRWINEFTRKEKKSLSICECTSLGFSVGVFPENPNHESTTTTMPRMVIAWWSHDMPRLDHAITIRGVMVESWWMPRHGVCLWILMFPLETSKFIDLHSNMLNDFLFFEFTSLIHLAESAIII